MDTASTLASLLIAAGHWLRLHLGPDTPLPVSTAAWYLDVSEDHLYKLAQSNSVAFSKPGGKRLYFIRRDLDAYALQRRRMSQLELDERAGRVVSDIGRLT